MSDTTKGTARAWVLAFAQRFADAKDELTAFDQTAGDGDFGENIGGALRMVRDELTVPGSTDDVETLETTARVFLDRVGGTSGPLFGLLFQELAAAVRAAGRLNTAALREGTGKGLAAIQRVGEAEVADKTLVDALAPAADALAEHSDDQPLAAAFAAAAAAAEQGAENTRDIRARRGRASYVGEHARGVPDPGAVAVAHLFRAGG